MSNSGPTSRKRRRSIRTRSRSAISYQKETMPLNEINGRKGSFHRWNNLKNYESGDSSLRSSSYPLYLRCDGMKTSVICKPGSYDLKREITLKCENDLEISSCSTARSCRVSMVSDDKEGTDSYQETLECNSSFENEEYTESLSLGKKFVHNKNRRYPQRNHPSSLNDNDKACMLLPTRQSKRLHFRQNFNEDQCSQRPIETESNAQLGGHDPPLPKCNKKMSWADKTAESQGAQCNAIQVAMIDLLRTIRRKCDGRAYFSHPVDPVKDECPDYFEIIDKDNEAMDLGTMETLIRNRTIRNMTDFDLFLTRIVECALKYNTDSENLVRQTAIEFDKNVRPFVILAKKRIDKMNMRRKSSLSTAESLDQNGCKELEKTQNSKKSTRKKKKRTKHCSKRYDSENTEVMSSSSHLDSEYDCETKMCSDNKPTRAQHLLDKGQSRGIQRKYVFVDELSDDESYDIQQIDGADIPFCEKDLSGSFSKPCVARKEWISLCPKLVVVCNEAARRATLVHNPNADRYDKPLSETYIKERLMFGNSIRGHTVWMKPKNKACPIGLQGFVVTTDFMTWKETLRFSMNSPATGLTPGDKYVHARDNGLITKYLEQAERIRIETTDGAIIFKRVAEIAILGGLGCGSYLLRKALDDLDKSKEYDIVVLQATKNAIPFYHKHGFLRIGAVARHKDERNMPETAYRHWSEICDGEVVEASYMMAYPLPSSSKFSKHPSRNSKLKISNVPTKTLTHCDIELSLLSAKQLIVTAMNLKTSLSSGGRATFYDLISTARDFGAAAKDTKLVTIIERTIKQAVGYSVQHSKSILRMGLGLQDEINLTNQNILSNAQKVIFVKINVQDDLFSPQPNGGIMEAIVPEHFMKKNENEVIHSTLTVRLFCDGKPFFGTSMEGEKDYSSLEAIISVPEQNNVIDMKYGSTLAFHNIRKTAEIAVNGKDPESWETMLMPSDHIMLQDRADDGSPLWQTAFLQGKNSDISKDKDIYLVSFSNEEGTSSISLDRSCKDMQRGVGRKWCTPQDWGRFSDLPIFVLDLILIGAWVQYTDFDGCVIQGYIIKRIGGGLHDVPRWRIHLQSKRRQTRTSAITKYRDLTSAELRDIIIVDDDHMKRIMTAIARMGPLPKIPDRLISSFFWIDKAEMKCNPESSVEKIELNAKKDEIDEWVVRRMKNQMLGKWKRLSNQDDSAMTTMEKEKKVNLKNSAVVLTRKKSLRDVLR